MAQPLVFISYSHKDKEEINGLLTHLGILRQAGLIDGWSDKRIQAGGDWEREIEQAMTQAKVAILLVTANFLNSEFILSREVPTLLKRRKKEGVIVFPIIARACAWEEIDWLAQMNVRPENGRPVWADQGSHVDEDLTDIAREIAQIVKQEREALIQIQKAVRPPCPYPGMVPFDAKDARFFYGRDEEIRKIHQHLRHHRFLFVIGPSGSGKSSLVCAGLLPKLRESSYFPKDFWFIRELRLGPQPEQALVQAIGGDLAQPDLSITTLLAGHAPAKRLLLVIDQFEELFTLVADRSRQNRIIKHMQDLLTLENCALLIVMRADFYPDLMNSDLWPVDPSQRLEIAPLRGEKLRQAIEQPAADVGVELEAGLVERLMADAAEEPGALPMVQETMFLLWEEIQNELLPLKVYEQLGGEGRTGLAVAMATKADATLNDLPLPKEQTTAIARRIFLRLVQFGEGRADTRRQQPVTALKAAGDDLRLFEQTLHNLTNNRLLTLSGAEKGDDRQVDIAHEALISGWPTLQRWLAERREAEQIRRRLELKVADWVRLGRGNSGLLDQIGLIEAQRWLDSPDAVELGYSEDLPTFVNASQAASDAAEQEKEVARLREAQLKTISQIINAIKTYEELPVLLQSILDVSLPRLNAQAGTIQLLDRTTNELVLEAAVGTIDQDQSKRISLDQGITGQAAREKKPIYISDTSRDERFPDYLGSMHSELAIPLLQEGEVIGVFNMEDPEPNAFDETTRELAQLIADQTAIVIQNARLYGQAREELIASRQLAALGIATAAIQHRINNTLNIINPNIVRLKRRVDQEDATIREIMDIIERNTRYTAEYIQRIQEPLKDTIVWDININLSLQDAHSQVQQQYPDIARFGPIEVNYELDETLPPIKASLGQTTEIFRNLIENSYEAMADKGGNLDIISRRVDKWLEVEISDNGPGIPPEIRDKLFIKPVPSKQPGQTGQGSGLGLWLSALILQRYAGEIKIKDTGPKGTTMVVRLPVPST